MGKKLVRHSLLGAALLVAALAVGATSVALAACDAGATAGDDVINCDSGNIVNANTGNDVVTGNGNGNVFFGEGDSDTLTGNGNGNVLFGGDGNDTLTGNGDGNVLFGDANDDSLSATGTSNVLFGGSDNDSLTFAGTGNIVFGDNGDDVVIFQANSGDGNAAFGGAHVNGDTLVIVEDVVIEDGSQDDVPDNTNLPGAGSGWGLLWGDFENAYKTVGKVMFLGHPRPDCGKNPYAWNAISGQYERMFHEACQQFTGDPNESLLHGTYWSG